MSDTKISQDPSASPLVSTAIVPIVQDGTNKKTTVADIVAGSEKYHGIEAIGAKSFDSNTHVLTLASVTYWYKGTKYTTASPVTCDLDSYVTLTADTTYFIYFDDATGTLKASASAWNLHEAVPAALLLWNGTVGVIGHEHHNHTRDIDWHKNAHHTIGTRYQSGLVQAAPSTAVDNQINIGAGTIWDEDIELTIGASTTARLWYKTATGYTFESNPVSVPYKLNGSQIQYLDTDTNTLTDIANNRYGVMWVYATSDTSVPIYLLVGEGATSFASVSDARAALPPNLANSPFNPEAKLIYKWIFAGDGQYQESADYRQSSTLPAGGATATSAASVTFTPTGNVSATSVQGAIEELDSEKQATLVSGTNIKTINGSSILGSGDLTVEGGSGMSNPMTTAGDIIYGGTSGVPTRLAKGDDDEVLTLVNGVPAWAAASGGSQVTTISGNLTLYITQQTTLTITNYDSATSYSVNAVSGSASITGDTITYTAGNTAGTDMLTITAGSSSRDITITVNSAGIATPTNTTPTNGATDQSGPTLALSATAFSWTGLEDTHASSDWELATDSGFTTVVASSNADTINKTSWTTTVSASQTYYWRVRYRGASGRVSDWSTATSFTTKSSFGGLIGTAGAQGFGVGVYNGTLPSGFSAMTGTTDPSSDNYGNYQYSDGSVMCFVPRFYYRIGSASSPRYATYGANAVDIVGIETFADEAAANAAGYAMPRAFIDGGFVKSGFFIDKYLCSKDGTLSCKSIKNGVPISLTTTAGYTNSNGMVGGACTGILADAVTLSRARGVGIFNCASIFMYSTLALLSLAHGQAATAATYCAWYDAAGTTNFPKGCNNGSLADHLDATVTFTTAGDSGSSAKPLTGSASNLAKTTHNGQNCGAADLSGALYQVMLGLTDFGTSATDITQHTDGNVYLLKTSVALSSLTAGWDGTTDAWGNTTSLATKYDAVTGLLPWGATTGWLYMGNGTNRVLDPATSGAGYQRTSCGIPQDTAALSAGGTNLYGNDGQYQYNRANLFPLASGAWNLAASAGLFCRVWSSDRSNDYSNCGFRASCYGV